METGGAIAMMTSTRGSQPQRPRPDARSSATTPPMSRNQATYPIWTVGTRECDRMDHWYMAMMAVEQCRPSCPLVGKGTP